MSIRSLASAPVTAQEGTNSSWTDVRTNQPHYKRALRATSTTLAQAVKAAAQSDLPVLVEEAGFRLARGRTYHCAEHTDRNPSVHLYEDGPYCFSCTKRYDAIDLARLIIGGSTGDAIRWLAARYGVVQEGSRQLAPRFSEIEYTNAELFRTGLCWAIQNELEELTQPLLGTGLFDGEQIFKLTALLSEARTWSPRQATVFFIKLRSRDLQRVRRWMRDALEFQLAIATVIAYAGAGSARAL